MYMYIHTHILWKVSDTEDPKTSLLTVSLNKKQNKFDEHDYKVILDYVCE